MRYWSPSQIDDNFKYLDDVSEEKEGQTKSCCCCFGSYCCCFWKICNIICVVNTHRKTYFSKQLNPDEDPVFGTTLWAGIKAYSDLENRYHPTIRNCQTFVLVTLKTHRVSLHAPPRGSFISVNFLSYYHKINFQ